MTFAADKGHVEVVKLLIARGADVNAQDTFYQMRAIDMAMMNNHSAVVALLLERGSKGAPGVLPQAIQRGDAALVAIALASPELTTAHSVRARGREEGQQSGDHRAHREEAGGDAGRAGHAGVTVDRATLQSYAGSYRNEEAGAAITFTLNGEQLTADASRWHAAAMTLVATSPTSFRVAEREGLTINFEGRGGMIERARGRDGNTPQVWTRVATPPAGAPSAAGRRTPHRRRQLRRPAAADTRPAARTAARNWPGFRGDNAAGNGDGQGAVVEWDVDDARRTSAGRRAIPGISNASPIVWGNRVFVVTAISSAGDKTFRTGLYGDVAPVNDLSEHTWKIYCLDKATGKIAVGARRLHGRAEGQAPHEGQPGELDAGHRRPARRRDVRLDRACSPRGTWTASRSGRPTSACSTAAGSSIPTTSGALELADHPRQHVIVQADRQKDSFIAAYDAATGKERWRTARDEISTWGTPTVFRAGNREQIVTNGPKIRGYDPATGKLLWTLGPNSEVTVGTPVVGNGVVYVTGGYPPVRPVYAIKPTASGDISLPKDQTSNEAIAWSNGEGTYIPTPIFYDGILYTCGNNGVVTAYDGTTGERLYRARVGGGGSFSASPIAADGRLYFANEDGDIFVARAGRTYQEIAKNEMKEVIMSTPAISDGVVIVRTLGHVYGIGQK